MRGKGGHAAQPHETRDPIVAAAALVLSLQTLVSRNLDPVSSAVLSVASLSAGGASNVIPDEARILGTIRALDDSVFQQLKDGIERIAKGISLAHDVRVEVDHGCSPFLPTINDRREVDFVESALRSSFGDERVQRGHAPSMASEDFSCLAREVPGCYALIGNGDSAPLHHPAYDFNDEVAPLGVAYWVRLVERALPRG